MASHGTRFETRVTILAATLLCELGRADDPRKDSTRWAGSQSMRTLTFKESVKILEDYGIKHYENT